jgi:hypothetical protein
VRSFPPLAASDADGVQLGSWGKLPLVDSPIAGPMILRAWPPQLFEVEFQQQMVRCAADWPVAVWCNHLEEAELACRFAWVDALVVEYSPFVPEADEDLFWQAQQAGKACWVRNPDGLQAPAAIALRRETLWQEMLLDFAEYQGQVAWLASAFARYHPAVTTLLHPPDQSGWSQALALPALDELQTYRLKRQAAGLKA